MTKQLLTPALALAAGFTIAAPASAALDVDFGPGDVQAGFEGLSTGAGDNNPRSDTFTGDFFGTGSTTVTVSVSSVDQRTRGGSAVPNTDLDDVFSDAFKQSGSAGDITLTLSGLDANTTYSLTSFHHDNGETGGDNTGLLTATGSTVAPVPILQTNQTTNTVANGGPGQETYDIVTDGSGVASVTFNRTTIGGPNEGFINGISLDLDVIPEPASLALLGLGGLLLLPRRKRA